MSRPAAAASLSLPFELVFDDGIPMDHPRHVSQMYLFQDLVRQVMAERGRRDYYTAGNAFVYYSVEQAEDVAKGRPYFRGPDFFLVDGVPRRSGRRGWVSWEEGGRLPDLIVEMLSPSTAHIDRTDKKDLYARVFRTREYFLWDIFTSASPALEGLRLAGDSYRPIRPNAQGRIHSQVLGLDLGLWRGVYREEEDTWVRFFEPDGRMVPTPEEAQIQRAEAEHERAEAEHERAEAEHERAEAERQRAEAMEAELRRLRSLLGGSGDGS